MAQNPRPGRSPLSDIERFLREVEQLRRKAASEQTKSEPPIDEVEVVRPARPAKAPPPRPIVVVKMPPPPSPREPDVVEVIPVQPAVSSPPAKVRPTPGSSIAASPIPAVIAESATPPAPPRPKSVSPPSAVGPPANLARQLIQTLRSRETVPLAILLTEVLGPPRCRRHRF